MKHAGSAAALVLPAIDYPDFTPPFLLLTAIVPSSIL
jgi:hypothetical protein